MMMRALKAFDYGKQHLQPGDTFRLENEHGAPDVHRHILIAAQLAEDLINGNHTAARPKRRYKRRDMRAEE